MSAGDGFNAYNGPISRTVSTLDLRNARSQHERSRASGGVGGGGSPSRTKPPMKLFSVGSPLSKASVGDRYFDTRRSTSALSPSHLGHSSHSSSSSSVAPVTSTAASVIPFSIGTPTEAAAALHFFQSLEQERDALAQRNLYLEEALSRTVNMFAGHVSAVEASVGPVSLYYSVSFGPGGIGMILTADDAGNIEVAELRDDPETGHPLLAKASGKVSVGDYVIAVNERLLSRYGTPTPEYVANEFRNSPRPLTVLFARNGEARMRELGGGGGGGEY